MKALLDPDRNIKLVVRKLTPTLVIGPGDCVVDYNAPAVDDTLEYAAPVQPVAPEDTAVQFVVVRYSIETAWAVARARRNVLLLSSDWTDTLSAPGRLGAELYAEWQAYRQALRDVTGQADPFELVWPAVPGQGG